MPDDETASPFPPKPAHALCGALQCHSVLNDPLNTPVLAFLTGAPTNAARMGLRRE